MCIGRKAVAFAAGLALVLTASVALALPVEIPNFAVDPSGPEFTINPLPPGAPTAINLAEPPQLDFGQTSLPDLTNDSLMMSWDAVDPTLDSQAGWELVFGVDPDIRNEQIRLSVNPPGGWLPDPILPGVAPDIFVGIKSVSVVAVDINNNWAGWGFNTDMDWSTRVTPAPIPNAPVNDPLASGWVSLQNNFMHDIVINIGNGPAAGSAMITPLGAPFAGPFSGPNFLVASASPTDFSQIVSLQFLENGVIMANANVIPGQVQPGLLNYWDHVTVTPEPSTFVLLGMGAFGLLVFAWRKRRRR